MTDLHIAGVADFTKTNLGEKAVNYSAKVTGDMKDWVLQQIENDSLERDTLEEKIQNYQVEDLYCSRIIKTKKSLEQGEREKT